LGYNNASLRDEKTVEVPMHHFVRCHPMPANDQQLQPELQNREGCLPDISDRFEPLLDTVEAAKLLRIHPKTLRRSARLGEIPATRIGRLWRFRASVLNEWLERIAS